MPTDRRDPLRRYPALGFLAVAAALALLLPSRLSTPRSAPAALAEFAPVPGRSQAGADVSDLSEASSDGVAAGGRAPVERDGSVAGPAQGLPGRTIPGQLKRCVGDPPRQTEDPLSPPCVASFNGDNGGATSRGVTADLVAAVVVFDVSQETDPRWQDVIDCAEPVAPDDTTFEIMCKSYMTFFNDRYQTYDRTVRLYASHKAPVPDVIATIAPFASSYINPHDGYARERVLSVGHDSFGRAAYHRYAPYLTGFRPDLEDIASMAAGYVCGKLQGGSAAFAGELEAGKIRRFGVWNDNPRKNPNLHPVLVEALRSGCGVEAASVESVQDATAAASLQRDGVTSVLLTMGAGNVPVALQQATSIGWFPEWIVPGSPTSRGPDINFYGRLYDSAQKAQWAGAFGITFDYRRDHVRDQAWYQAYREGCVDCPEPAGSGYSGAPYIYDMIKMLFHGIQASGPKLTADGVVRGLRSIPRRASTDPYRPAAYFGPDDTTYLKDAMEIWWDPDGTAPGATTPGCYRLSEGGTRYRAGEWPSGDATIGRRVDAPCQGDTFPGG